jgi:hypothetical protein
MGGGGVSVFDETNVKTYRCSENAFPAHGIGTTNTTTIGKIRLSGVLRIFKDKGARHLLQQRSVLI